MQGLSFHQLLDTLQVVHITRKCEPADTTKKRNNEKKKEKRKTCVTESDQRALDITKPNNLLVTLSFDLHVQMR